MNRTLLKNELIGLEESFIKFKNLKGGIGKWPL